MRTALFTCALGAVASTAIAKPAPAKPVAKPAAPDSACTDPHHHEFDFWLGTWEVTDNAKKVVGHNTIESAHGGCAIYEHWTGAAGSTGGSLNYYDPSTQRWHQVWVDRAGDVIELEGALIGGAMILEGPFTHQDGAKTRLRGTWSKNADGSVRQLFEESKDGGVTWTVWFDGRYAKQP